MHGAPRVGGRAPEAAFFARTYAPSKISEMVALWKESLAAQNPKAAESIADPLDYPNLFDGLELSLKAQEWLSSHPLHEAPASVYPDHAADNDSDLLEHMRALAEGGGADAAAEPAAEAEAEAEPEMEDAVEPAPEAEAVPEAAAADEAAALEAELEADLADGGGGDAAAADDADLDAELDAELNQ